jgi:integrase
MTYSEIERAIDQFIAHKKAEGLAKSTTDDMRYRIRRFVRECQFETFADVDEQTCIDWFVSIAELDSLTKLPRLSANSRKLYSVYVGGFFEWAVFNDLIATNPCARAPRPKKFKKDRRKFRRAMTESELEKLILVARLRPMAEYAKMRIVGSRNQEFWVANPITLENIEGLAEDCEILTKDVEKMRVDGLKWSLAYRMLALVGVRWEELRTLAAGQFTFGDEPEVNLKSCFTKNGNSDRLPLPQDLATDLEAWIRDQAIPADMAIFVLPAKGLKRFLRDIEVAGIARYDSQGRSIDIHCLRYSFGTLLAKRGVHVSVAQRLMRHSTPGLTLGIYTSVESIDSRSASNTLPSLGREAANPASEATKATDDHKSMLLKKLLANADAETLRALLAETL